MSIQIYPKNEAEAAFLKELLERMEVVYEEENKDADHIEEEEFNSDALYEGLNLDLSTTSLAYEDLPEEAPKSSETGNAEKLHTALEKYGGAWEDDDSETLDQLLNMLTP